MSDQDRPSAGLEAAELEALAREGEAVAARLADAFEATGETIAASLRSAARSGELSFSDMAESILSDLAQIALERLVIDPVSHWTDQINSSLGASIADVIGQRALGGPVLGGAPYLVGEQGPEVFVPAASGAVTPAPPAPVIHVTVNASGDAATAIQRSERQISAAIARAAAAGGRML